MFKYRETATRLQNSRFFFSKSVNKSVKRGVRVLPLPSLALCFQARSRPFVWLLARTWIRIHTQKYGLFCSLDGDRILIQLRSLTRWQKVINYTTEHTATWRGNRSFRCKSFQCELKQYNYNQAKDVKLFTRRLDQLVSKRPVTLDSVQGILFRYGYMGLKSEQISGITGFPLTSISCGTKSDVRYQSTSCFRFDIRHRICHVVRNRNLLVFEKKIVRVYLCKINGNHLITETNNRFLIPTSTLTWHQNVPVNISWCSPVTYLSPRNRDE